MSKLTASDKQMYAEFRSDNLFCWACKTKPLPPIFYLSPEWKWLTQHLEIHHIIGGSGRKHDRRASSSLCKIHHGTYHGERYRPTKDTPLIEPLTLGQVCWLKREFDPDHFDLDFIRSLRIKHNAEIVLEVVG